MVLCGFGGLWLCVCVSEILQAAHIRHVAIVFQFERLVGCAGMGTFVCLVALCAFPWLVAQVANSEVPERLT